MRSELPALLATGPVSRASRLSMAEVAVGGVGEEVGRQEHEGAQPEGGVQPGSAQASRRPRLATDAPGGRTPLKSQLGGR